MAQTQMDWSTYGLNGSGNPMNRSLAMGFMAFTLFLAIAPGTANAQAPAPTPREELRARIAGRIPAAQGLDSDVQARYAALPSGDAADAVDAMRPMPGAIATGSQEDLVLLDAVSDGGPFSWGVGGGLFGATGSDVKADGVAVTGVLTATWHDNLPLHLRLGIARLRSARSPVSDHGEGGNWSPLALLTVNPRWLKPTWAHGPNLGGGTLGFGGALEAGWLATFNRLRSPVDVSIGYSRLVRVRGNADEYFGRVYDRHFGANALSVGVAWRFKGL